MRLDKNRIAELNKAHLPQHKEDAGRLIEKLYNKGIDADSVINKLIKFQIAIPSWALGTGGTRFGRFSGPGEPTSLESKIEDVGLLHALNQSSGAISLHIPWDVPSDVDAICSLAKEMDVKFDAVNSNTFQDQKGQALSYKYGSLMHVNKEVRDQAIAHNIEVINHGTNLGAKALTVWLADGTCFPGQANFRKSFENTLDSLKQIYAELPADWNLLVEYKPYEPNFYSMAIPDWGTSHMMAQELGDKALSLVDLGHHLPNTNIEQIVAILMMRSKLGGFHFNDSKYGDDDVTSGSLKPYQLFLIFNELVDGMDNTDNPDLSWMIDASHNLKDPMEDLLQAVEAIMIAYAQALIVDRKALADAQEANDIARAQEILQDAYRTDVRVIVAEARIKGGAAWSPLETYRQLDIRKALVDERGKYTLATGL
ncbi:sugar isomerase [Reichenbachiella carrageenanivorans]|uniref:Sugar isomerase n=1 Tax=Reichenbachiella carrageenanivorans TaxID=2979869 RepID=A0ABY6D4D0_9BACT|nr:sugar isomerase [Reichenbachiella carrageenanivorans]UXX81007.1 sugar isomerase [Reichenbachiella carrageenanivorans]